MAHHSLLHPTKEIKASLIFISILQMIILHLWCIKCDSAYEVTAKSDADRYFVLTNSIDNYSTQIVLYDQINDSELNITSNNAENRFLTFMGNTLLFSSNYNSNFEQLWSVNLKTNEQKKVFNASWDIVGANFYNHTNSLHVFINEDASTKLIILSAEDFSELPNNILPAEGLKGFSKSRANDQYAFIYGSDTSPGDLFISNASFDEASIVGRSFDDLDEGMMVASEVIRFESFDGLEIPSILYKPKGASASNPAPVMVHMFMEGQEGKLVKDLTHKCSICFTTAMVFLVSIIEDPLVTVKSFII